MDASRMRRSSRPAARQGPLADFVALVGSLAAAALLVLAGVASLAGPLLMDPARWIGALDQARAWDAAPGVIAGQLVRWSDERPAGEARPLGPLDQADTEALVAALAPPAWIRAQVGAAVTGLLAGLAAEAQGPAGPAGSARAELHAVVTLDEVRARLAGPQGVAAIEARLATWPACTAEQEAQLLGPTPPRCRPTSVSPAQVAAVIWALLAATALGLPSSVDLAVPGPVPGSGILQELGAVDALRVVAGIHASASGLLLAALACLLLVAVARSPRPGRMSRAAGWPLLLAGLLLLATAALADPALELLLGSLEPRVVASGLDPDAAAPLLAAVRTLLGGAGGLLLPTALAITGAGLALVVLPALLGRGGGLERGAGR